MNTVLHEQSIAVLPPWFTVPLLVAGWTCFAIRVLLVTPKLPVDHAGNAFLGLTLIYPTLREPWFQQSILPAVSLSDIRSLEQCSAAAGGAALLAMVLLAVSKSHRRHPGRVVWPIIASTLVLWVIIWVTSLPARDRGLAIEQMSGDWRAGVQLTAFCISYPVAEVAILVALWRIWRTTGGNRSMRVFLVLAAGGAIGLSLVDTGSRIVGGFLLSLGIHNEWTQPLTQRSALQADMVLYPPILLCVLMALPSCMRAVRKVVHLDRPSLAVRKLTPMWGDLTAAVPDFLLRNVESSLTDASETEHRMRIELEDTIIALAEYLPADGDWPADPLRRAEVIRRALSLRAVAPTTVATASHEEFAPAWLADEDQVDALATAWTTGGVASSSAIKRSITLGSR